MHTVVVSSLLCMRCDLLTSGHTQLKKKIHNKLNNESDYSSLKEIYDKHSVLFWTRINRCRGVTMGIAKPIPQTQPNKGTKQGKGKAKAKAEAAAAAEDSVDVSEWAVHRNMQRTIGCHASMVCKRYRGITWDSSSSGGRLPMSCSSELLWWTGPSACQPWSLFFKMP